MPRTTCGQKNCQKPDSLVRLLFITVPMPISVRPKNSSTRRSTELVSRPTIGAVKNIATPVTNITSPICRLE